MRGRLINVVLTPDRQRLVLSVYGEVDIATACVIGDALDAALADGWTRLVLDLRRVDFMDSSGVHLLERSARRAACVELVGGPAGVERLLALTGRDDVLPRADAFVLPPIAVEAARDDARGAWVERLAAERAARRTAPLAQAPSVALSMTKR